MTKKFHLSLSNSYSNGATKDILSVSNTNTNGATLYLGATEVLVNRYFSIINEFVGGDYCYVDSFGGG